MSIKVYKGLVVPFPCHKDWKWMLTKDISGCYNVHPEGENVCRHIDCHDCVYLNAEARAEYYKNFIDKCGHPVCHFERVTK